MVEGTPVGWGVTWTGLSTLVTELTGTVPVGADGGPTATAVVAATAAGATAATGRGATGTTGGAAVGDGQWSTTARTKRSPGRPRKSA